LAWAAAASLEVEAMAESRGKAKEVLGRGRSELLAREEMGSALRALSKVVVVGEGVSSQGER
jgi:hypothetical protein